MDAKMQRLEMMIETDASLLFLWIPNMADTRIWEDQKMTEMMKKEVKSKSIIHAKKNEIDNKVKPSRLRRQLG